MGNDRQSPVLVRGAVYRQLADIGDSYEEFESLYDLPWAVMGFEY